MRLKISHKLAVYFAFCLLLFSLLTGSIFMVIFQNHTLNIHKTDMEKTGLGIANTLSSLLNETPETVSEKETMHMRMMGQKNGLGAYLRFLNELSTYDTCVIDSDHTLVSTGKGKWAFTYEELPAEAELIIDEVLSGQLQFSRGFRLPHSEC